MTIDDEIKIWEELTNFGENVHKLLISAIKLKKSCEEKNRSDDFIEYINSLIDDLKKI